MVYEKLKLELFTPSMPPQIHKNPDINILKTDNKEQHLWDEFCRMVKDSTPVDQTEDDAARLARIARLEADPEVWFQYYFPKYCSAPPAQFHIAATQRILAHPEWYEVRSWSRELAKSTRTMMETFYLVLVGYQNTIAAKPGKKAKPGARRKKRNVLLISNSLDNAVRLLMPYKINLEVNQRIISDYGAQEKTGAWTEAEFITRSGVSFRALGAGQSPRGTRNEEVRPDIILFDDVDTDEDCRNPEIIRHRWNWIQQAVIPTRSISNPLLVIFCGNIIAKDCCIVRAQDYADKVEIINIRDDEGMSSWPEKNNEEDIERVLSLLSYSAIQKEYYNNPIQEGSVFSQMHYKPARPIKEYAMLVCYTDPSYKESKHNDYKATVLCGKWRDEYHIIKAFVFQGTVAQMIDNHFAIMDLVGSCACFYLMEQVFLQDMFLKEFYDTSRQHNRTIPIAGDKRTKPDKFVRIESLLEPLNRNGKLYLNEDEKDHPGMKTLAEQFLAFAPGSRVHDDGPDAVEGAIWTINNKQSLTNAGAITAIPRKGDRNGY